MDIATARQMVVTDQRESYPDMTAAEAIGHAVDTLVLPGTPHTRSTDEVQMDGTQLADAYCMVLRAAQDKAAA